MRARKRPFVNLPVCITSLLCIAIVHALVFELIPAVQENRAIRAAVRQQIATYERLLAERAAKEKQYRGLHSDPQEVERALDANGLLPKAPPDDK